MSLMARKNDTTENTEGLSEAALAARAAVASRPRQSVVRYVQHYRTIKEAAPELLDELFGDQIEALEEVADQVESPIQVAIDKVAAEQVGRSTKAVRSTDPLTGYGEYRFSRELFDEKTAPKKERKIRSVGDKLADVAKSEDLTDEEREVLNALMAKRRVAA